MGLTLAKAPAASVQEILAPSVVVEKRSAGYIVSPLYDWIYFLFPPMLALGIGILISGTPFAEDEVDFHGHSFSLAGLLASIMVHAHLVIVFFRSHGNQDIYALYPRRFIWVPFLLYGAMLVSSWILVAVTVLATFWDVYHSGLQTFGFARIYDRKAGNDPDVGRRLDWWLNHFLYIGPILAGVTMMDHFGDFSRFDSVGPAFLAAVPGFMESNHRYFTWAVLLSGSAFLVYYVAAYWQYYQHGYRVSFLKVYLLVSTGFCSIYSWGFNTWGEAFIIMNFFHALQYFGIVWAFERKNMQRIFGLEQWRLGKPITAILFLGIGFGYGYWVVALDSDFTLLFAITLMVSIMHFWYDGFIWSVRKQQV